MVRLLCSRCGGTGWIKEFGLCVTCEGMGYVQEFASERLRSGERWNQLLPACFQTRTRPQYVANADQIKYMVDRFLGWRLPDNFNPDGGIKFAPYHNIHPTGTNLLDATQAEQMIRYLIDRMPTTGKENTMQPHQERVVVEKKELDEKLEKLLAFIDAGKGPVYAKLVTEERERLTTQARIMREYSDVLADRITAFQTT